MNDLTIRPGSMPAHLQQGPRLNLNAAAHANLVGGGFPVLSYKGKTWSVKHHGNWELLKNSPGNDHKGKPLPVQPAQYLDVIIVGMATNLSKIYYEKSYSTGDNEAPDCFSVDSLAPDPGAPRKQHTSCKVCPKNQWGSRMTDSGKKAKACTDNRRLALVPADDPSSEVYGGPMLLRVPPMSLLNLDRYATKLEQLGGADISQVVTRISFVPEMQYPALQFDPIGWVQDPEVYRQVVEHSQSDQVRRMLNDAQVQGGANGEADNDNANQRFQRQLGARPAHLAQAQADALATAVANEHAAQQAKIAVNQGQNAANPPVQVAQAPTSMPAPRAVPLQAAPPVIQGAPDDLEDAVDDLLSGN